ncbi:hypothetical protein AAG570_010212 [Ranatra chinensis]|uniref:Uncharacterized protein n=1 Tax=Ranatra chinensis TaxID=642074 RepID=A0ABD0YLX3_9HEMI
MASHSNWGNVELLESLRSQVAVFQEGRGVAKESYTFMTLMSAIMTLGGQAVHAVFTLMMALAPVSEIALHVARFALENLVDILNTPDSKDIAVKVITRYTINQSVAFIPKI